jgi:hypothetical protein
MTSYRDYIEENQDTLMIDWQKYIIDINKTREKHGLTHQIFSTEEKKEFEQQWVNNRIAR